MHYQVLYHFAVGASQCHMGNCILDLTKLHESVTVEQAYPKDKFVIYDKLSI